MRVIFCDSGFSPKEVDYMYADEFESAKENQISVSLISFEEVKKGNIESAIKRVKESEEKTIGVYRGWMLKPNQYQKFYDGLLQKNIELINNPTQYKLCHYLPESYELIKDYTPKSTFKSLNRKFDINEFKDELSVFGNKPIVIKDYVKSQKHYWKEACYIPDASNSEQVNSVVNKFIELQDVDFNEGLVFREFIDLEELTNHSASGMPLTKEFRIFVRNNEVMSTYKYWDEGDYNNVKPILNRFQDVLQKIDSQLFTMDIAKKKDGEWIIVELGDGQVAGLPDNADKKEFYNKLKESASV